MLRRPAPRLMAGVLLAGLLAMGADARAENPCLPDAYAAADPVYRGDSGIGGTGRGDEDSGIGGTGIYGTITGFGSICVNGLRIGYDDASLIEINGQPSGASDLAMGQRVWVVAVTAGDSLWARKIAVFSAAIGRIEMLDLQERRLRVSGGMVEVPASAIVLDPSGGAGDLAGLDVGDLIDVSGLRHPDGHIVATRIASARGPLPAKVEPPDLEALLGAAADIRRLSIEGYLRPGDRAHGAWIDGLEIDTSTLTQRDTLAEDRPLWIEAIRTPDDGVRASGITLPPLPPVELHEPIVPGHPPRLGASDLPQVMRPGSGAAEPATGLPPAPGTPSGSVPRIGGGLDPGSSILPDETGRLEPPLSLEPVPDPVQVQPALGIDPSTGVLSPDETTPAPEPDAQSP